MNLPPVILIALEDYERVSALLDVQFPGIAYGWSPFVPEGTIYGIDTIAALKTQESTT